MSCGCIRRLSLAGLWAGLLASGCVRRSFTIETIPPGAEVFLGGQPMGHSPVTRSFTFYGPRTILLRKDGYEVKTVVESLRPPWYQRFPVDLVSESVYPGDLQDHRLFLYYLEPTPGEGQTDASSATLESRAQEGQSRLNEVPLDSFTKGDKRRRRGHGSFPYPAREREWWHQR